jgi:hypothetical protein
MNLLSDRTLGLKGYNLARWNPFRALPTVALYSVMQETAF